MRNKTFFGAFWLGIGLVGMLDGVIFHQILQWHSTYMHTDRFHQIVSDGIFHLAVTFIIFFGAFNLWKSDSHSSPQSRSLFWSGILIGGGTFNLAEGIINHHVFQFHHVKYGENYLFYDILFDVVALFLIILGIVIRHKAKRHAQ